MVNKRTATQDHRLLTRPASLFLCMQSSFLRCEISPVTPSDNVRRYRQFFDEFPWTRRRFLYDDHLLRFALRHANLPKLPTIKLHGVLSKNLNGIKQVNEIEQLRYAFVYLPRSAQDLQPYFKVQLNSVN